MAPNVQPPRGMRDFLPADKAKRDAVMGSIRATFGSYGFREIETPVAEDIDRLTGGEGGDNEKLVFRILRRGLDPGAPVDPATAADLGLRFDLTLPLTRFYATHRGELPAVFRSIQIAPVWRAERPQKGRYRQFTQCDIDVIGEPGELAEIELLSATIAAFDALGIGDLTVRLNDRRILTGLLDACGFPPSAHAGALITVDKLDKVGLAGVADELRGGGGAGGAANPGDAVDRLVGLLEELDPAGPGDRSVAATVALLPPTTASWAAGLVRIDEAVRATTPGATIVADPTLVRGMGYYTGPIFELSHPSSSSSVGGGGRYDGMVGRLLGADVPACGSSIGFERVIELVGSGLAGGARRQLALIHAADAAPATLVGWQRRLIAEGADVRLVARTRNTGKLLADLAAEGFEAHAAVGADTPAPTDPAAALDLRPIRT